MSHLALAFSAPVGPDRAILGRFTLSTSRLHPFLIAPAGLDTGLTALARSDRYLFAAHAPLAHLGETDPGLLVYRREDFLFEGRYLLTGLADVRGLFWWDETLYASSSGTRQVVAFRTSGPRLHTDRFTWNAPPELDGLGSLTLHGADFFVASPGQVWNITRGLSAWPLRAGRAYLLSTGDHLLALLDSGLLVPLAPRPKSPDGREKATSADPELALPGPSAGLSSLAGRLNTTCLHPSTGLSLATCNGPTLADLRPLPIPPILPVDLIAAEEAGGWPDETDASWAHSHARPI